MPGTGDRQEAVKHHNPVQVQKPMRQRDNMGAELGAHREPALILPAGGFNTLQ